MFTVVKWGHTEGIEREKTSSQKSHGIALDFWIHFSHSNLRAEYNWRAIPALIFWFKYLQKVNTKCPQISDEKNKFCSIDEHFLIFFLKDQKLFVKGQNFFSSSEIWGHFEFTFCRYLNQNMRAFRFYRYCLQNLFLDAI